MKAKDFDKKFDDGKEDIIDDLDLSKGRRINQAHKRINVDFPSWVIESLDKEAARVGVAYSDSLGQKFRPSGHLNSANPATGIRNAPATLLPTGELTHAKPMYPSGVGLIFQSC